MKLTVCLGVLNEPSIYGNVMTEEHFTVIKERIVKNGGIYGESSIPALNNLSTEEMYRRIKTVDMSKVSHCIKGVHMDGNKIMAAVETTGPHSHLLEMQTDGNTSFSISTNVQQPKFGIRGLKRHTENGEDLIDIVSFDLVTP